MTTAYNFDRVNVLKVVSKAIGTEAQTVLTRSIGLAQLVLQGDVSDAEKLQLVSLKDFPKADDKIGKERFKYANKLVKEMAVVRLVSDEIKAELMALDPTDNKTLKVWQGMRVLDGHVILNGNAFLRYLADNVTEENKAAMATTARASTSKAKTPTATATAKTEQVTVDAIQAQPDEAAILAAAALAEMINADSIVGKAVAAVNGKDQAVAIVELAKAWEADRAQLLAQIEAQKARIAQLTAPAMKKGKNVNQVVADAMTNAGLAA